jgi:hypothetical protein
MRLSLRVPSCIMVWLCLAAPAVASQNAKRHKSAAEVNATIISGDSSQFHLRGHTRNKLIHGMFVCANPTQQEVSPSKPPSKCKDKVFPNATFPPSQSWGGGSQLKCMGVIPEPECIAKGTICLNGEVAIPPAPCRFPFEYQGTIYNQCVQPSLLPSCSTSTTLPCSEPGDPESWCFDVPNFKTPCSFAAKMAGCVDDAPTREAYDDKKVKRACKCEPKGYWNAPPTGGTVLTIIGSGFGSSEKDCDKEYMVCLADVIKSTDNDKLSRIDEYCIDQVYGSDSALGHHPEYLPEDENSKPDDDAYPQNCRFHQCKIGYTTGSSTWTSDTSIAMVVPPGIGDGLTLDLKVGRFKYSANDFRTGMTEKLFSYDRPIEASIAPTNSATLRSGVVLTVFGRHFGSSQHCVNVRLGSTNCLVSVWSSDTSLRCVVPSGVGASLKANVELMECPPDLDATGTTLVDPYKCRTTSETGLTKAFSYDAPSLSMFKPPNGPPAGYNLITVFGKNFGPFLDWQVEVVDQTTLEPGINPTMIRVANGVQAYSLAKYPGSSYYKGLHLELSYQERAASFAAGLEFICISDRVDQYDGRPCLCTGFECNHPACGPIRVHLNQIVLVLHHGVAP